MLHTTYDRLRAAGLTNPDASRQEVDRINSALTAQDVDDLISARNVLPSEEAITFSGPGSAHQSSTPPQEPAREPSDDPSKEPSEEPAQEQAG